MKLTTSVTIETADGDKMIPTTREIPEVDGNTLRNLVHQALTGALNDTMAFQGSRIRALSLTVEA